MKYIPLSQKFKIKWIFTRCQNIFELEGIIIAELALSTFSIDHYHFSLAHHKIKPGKMAYVRVRIPFVEKLSGIAIVKLITISYRHHASAYSSQPVYFANHNNTDETIHYTPQLSMGIVDI